MHIALILGLGFLGGLVVMIVILNLAVGSILPDFEKIFGMPKQIPWYKRGWRKSL